MATIRDVSQLAGVSVATVSRAFSAPDKVADRTLEKVRKAAEQLNYTPNSLSQIFRKKSTANIVVVVPDLANPFFSRVLSGIESVASQHGLSLLVVNSHDDPTLERHCLDAVKTHRADGMIQLGARTLFELADGGQTKDIPFIHSIEAPSESLSPSVKIDNAQAAEDIVSFLIKRGHSEIGLLGGLGTSAISRKRREGFRRALNSRGLEPNLDWVAEGSFSVAAGAEMATQVLSGHHRPTALFCMSDAIAIGAIRAICDAGLSVPGDISIAGFDNIEIGAYLNPALTTVTQPAQRMGEQSMQLLLKHLGQTVEDLPDHIVLPTEIIERESVKAID